MSGKDWDQWWQEGKTAFHMENVNPNLSNHVDTLLIKQNCTVFVPLCGKAVDMKYLADKGHKVIGLEFSEKAVVDSFLSNLEGKLYLLQGSR